MSDCADGAKPDLAEAFAASPMQVSLDRYLILSPCEAIKGTLRGKWSPAVCAELSERLFREGTTGHVIEVRVTRVPRRDRTWVERVPLAGSVAEAELAFEVPTREVGSGHHELTVSVAGLDGGRFPVPTYRGDNAATASPQPIEFCILEQESAPRSPAVQRPRPYLSFVVETIRQMKKHQSARIGGDANGVLFITVTGNSALAYLSLGLRRGNTYETGRVVEKPFAYHPTLADISIWPVLEQLSDATGSEEYRDWVLEMAAAFARHGFEPCSGLGYLGQACRLDVVRLKGVGTSYKPGPDAPLERLWEQAPERMTRMMKATYYGMVTRPDTMDYNRYCFYGFDDRARKPAMPFLPRHLPFAYSGACLIYWWGTDFARTGDPEMLQWARKMADKWLSMQHPESGLLPYFYFPSGTLSDSVTPTEYVSTGSASRAAVALFQAASEFGKRAEGIAFAAQLRTMAGKIARGIARFAYDPSQRIFSAYLHHDGSPFMETARYTFRTQADKDDAVKVAPALKDATVFSGEGFYEPGPYSRHSAGSDIPLQVAWCARENRDPCSLERCREWAEVALEASRRFAGPFTGEGKWTFAGSASYIRMLVILFELTGDGRCLEWARALADREMEHVRRVAHPEWWRMPERNGFLEALLALDSALRGH